MLLVPHIYPYELSLSFCNNGITLFGHFNKKDLSNYNMHIFVCFTKRQLNKKNTFNRLLQNISYNSRWLVFVILIFQSI